MRSLRVSIVGIILLVGVSLLAGVAIGAALSGLTAAPTPTPAPTVTDVTPSGGVPTTDVDGHDLEQLPRYPGSVRSEFSINQDDRWRTTVIEYLVTASLDDVRSFYQGVIVDFGWQRADVAFSGGEWTYVLVAGRTEAVVEIEQLGSLIEVDVLYGEPLAAPTPSDGGDDDDDDDDADDDG